MKAAKPEFTPAELETYRRIWRAKNKAGSTLAALIGIVITTAVITTLFSEDLTAWGYRGMKLISSAPPNQEPVGIYANEPASSSGAWRLCIYNGASPHLLGITSFVGGDRFRKIASSTVFSHRINAHNPEEAVALLARFRQMAKDAGAYVDIVAVEDHANRARPIIGKTIDVKFLREIRQFRIECGTKKIVFLGCSVASGEGGRLHIHLVADYCGLEVWAATTAVQVLPGLTGEQLVDSMWKSGQFIAASPITAAP